MFRYVGSLIPAIAHSAKNIQFPLGCRMRRSNDCRPAPESCGLCLPLFGRDGNHDVNAVHRLAEAGGAKVLFVSQCPALPSVRMPVFRPLSATNCLMWNCPDMTISIQCNGRNRSSSGDGSGHAAAEAIKPKEKEEDFVCYDDGDY